MSIGRTFAITVLSLALALQVGCKNSGPTIEGAGGLIGPKRVRVGEQFDVSQKFDPKTGAEWRLTSYDSAIVFPRDFPRLETGNDGSMHRKIRFIANTPGSTDLVFSRRKRQVLKPGDRPPEPEIKTITVRVVQ